jgi:Flp pilus assembly protein TadG
VVEFAIIAPLLFLLIFGIVEFGWAFSQNLDVRQGAREGARLAIVNYSVTTSSCTAGGTAACNNTRRDELLAEVCDRLDFDSDGTRLRIQREDGTDTGTQDFNLGDTVLMDVEKPLATLTGVLDTFLDSVILDSHVEMRIEQPAQWTEMGSGDWHTCP